MVAYGGVHCHEQGAGTARWERPWPTRLGQRFVMVGEARGSGGPTGNLQLCISLARWPNPTLGPRIREHD